MGPTLESLLRWTATIAVLLACGGGRAATNHPASVAGWICVEIPPGTTRVIALPFTQLPDDTITVPDESDDRSPLRVFIWSARNQAYLSADAVLKPTGHPGQWTIDDPVSPPGSVYLVENSSTARQWIFLGGRVGVDSSHKGILEPGLNLLGCPFGFKWPEKNSGLRMDVRCWNLNE
ncbi:MAG: hypothetical protein A2498_10900 [Lentisphaerae bacterium RIFOXYC12_FULL_60_16]|nr:MAG: hypothetical protein A2498_10900 [Lentisphaerae bacterium RIFOXYC12_FULL_60_16]